MTKWNKATEEQQIQRLSDWGKAELKIVDNNNAASASSIWENVLDAVATSRTDEEAQARLGAYRQAFANQRRLKKLARGIKKRSSAPMSIDAYLGHDVHNRAAQGVLNRSLRVAKGMSAAARRDLAAAIRRSDLDSGASVVAFVEKYRLQLAKLLSTTQMAALLEGAVEVAAKVPPLGEVVPVEGLLVAEQELVVEATRVAETTPTPFTASRPPAGSPEEVHLATIDEAVEFLSTKRVLDRAQYDALDAAARAKAFAVAGVDAEETLTKIRDVMVDNVARGADYAAFKSEVLEAVGAGTFLSDAHTETVFRTNVQSAFSDGQAAVLAHPLVRSGFPYSAYDAIHDDRARENHLALEHHGIGGTNVYRNDDPVFQLFRPPWDYGDRCSWTPMTVRQASEAGVAEAKSWLDTGVEPSVKAHVAMPPFAPPPGFARSIASAPLSIRLSIQSLATFSTDDKGHEHRGKGAGGGQFTKTTSTPSPKSTLPLSEKDLESAQRLGLTTTYTGTMSAQYGSVRSVVDNPLPRSVVPPLDLEFLTDLDEPVHSHTSFPVDQLKTVQDWITPSVVEKYKDDSKKQSRLPLVAILDGEAIILDGNHSVVAAVMRGDKSVDADYITITDENKEALRAYKEAMKTSLAKYGVHPGVPMSTDEGGREHRGKGAGGGQFTKGETSHTDTGTHVGVHHKTNRILDLGDGKKVEVIGPTGSLEATRDKNQFTLVKAHVDEELRKTGLPRKLLAFLCKKAIEEDLPIRTTGVFSADGKQMMDKMVRDGLATALENGDYEVDREEVIEKYGQNKATDAVKEDTTDHKAPRISMTLDDNMDRYQLTAEILVAMFGDDADNVAEEVIEGGRYDGAALAVGNPKVRRRYGARPGPAWHPGGTSSNGKQIWLWGAHHGGAVPHHAPPPVAPRPPAPSPIPPPTPVVPHAAPVSPPPTPAPVPAPAVAPPLRTGGQKARAASIAAYNSAITVLGLGMPLTAVDKAALAKKLTNMPTNMLRSLHTALGGAGSGGRLQTVASVRAILTSAASIAPSPIIPPLPVPLPPIRPIDRLRPSLQWDAARIRAIAHAANDGHIGPAVADVDIRHILSGLNATDRKQVQDVFDPSGRMPANMSPSDFISSVVVVDPGHAGPSPPGPPPRPGLVWNPTTHRWILSPVAVPPPPVAAPAPVAPPTPAAPPPPVAAPPPVVAPPMWSDRKTYDTVVWKLRSAQQLTPTDIDDIAHYVGFGSYSKPKLSALQGYLGLQSLWLNTKSRMEVQILGHLAGLKAGIASAPVPAPPTPVPVAPKVAMPAGGWPNPNNLPVVPHRDEVKWETGKAEAGTLNGVDFAPAPKKFWEHTKDVDVGEPPPLKKVNRCSILIQEPDGRVWVVAPTNEYGGRKYTMPGGTVEPGLTDQQNAIKETWEETGLQVEITGYLGDFDDANYKTPGQERNGRLYIGRRIGGAPWDAKVESHIVSNKTGKASAESETIHLVTPEKAAKLLHRSDDLAQLMAVAPIPVGTPTTGTGSGAIERFVKALQPKAQAYEAREKAKGNKPGNCEMHAVQEMRGYNAKPTVVAKTDMDALLSQGGHIEVLRGLSDTYNSTTYATTTGKQLANEFKSGAHFPGHGVFGSGTYADSNRSSSARGNVASGYANYSGSTLRMAIPKTARIIKESELEKLVPKCPDNFKGYNSSVGGKNKNECWLGVQAALAGYDAIEVDGKSGRHGDYGKGFYVILNRSIVTVQKEDATGHRIP